MILADTSIWIAHICSENSRLSALMEHSDILLHPMVLGELAMGTLPRRTGFLADLRLLPTPSVVQEDELLGFIERYSLHGRGIGYVDVHLLASARLTPSAKLWTLDKRLQAAAVEMSVSANLVQ